MKFLIAFVTISALALSVANGTPVKKEREYRGPIKMTNLRQQQQQKRKGRQYGGGGYNYGGYGNGGYDDGGYGNGGYDDGGYDYGGYDDGGYGNGGQGNGGFGGNGGFRPECLSSEGYRKKTAHFLRALPFL